MSLVTAILARRPRPLGPVVGGWLLAAVIFLVGVEGFSAGEIDAATFTLPLNSRHGLAEIDVNPAVVDQHIVHLEVGILARLGIVEFDEGVLQRVSCQSIANNFATVHTQKGENFSIIPIEMSLILMQT